MRCYIKIITPVILFLFLFTIQSIADEASHPAKGYHNYSALTKSLQDLANSNTKITQLTSIGKTLKGNDIWMLQLSGEKGPKPEDKQALLICGNLEGDHVIGSEVALGIAEYLVNGYGKDDEVTKILDKRTFYIIPRLNPDGAELFFDQLLAEHEGNLRPRDDDYDWQVDEDGPEDLNGDEMITFMRVKDKAGDWRIDEKDARLMLKKEKDTPLDSLYKIYPEGIDNDMDENYNEDGPGGYNIDRNFPYNFGYKIQGYQFYPASEPETRALIDFMNRYVPDLKTKPHQNICGILVFSKYDNLAGEPGIECGEATFPEVGSDEEESGESRFFEFGRRRSRQEAPQTPPRDPQSKKTDENDLPLFKKVSEQYKKITGIESTLSEKPVGSLLEWGYFEYGVPTFSANLWSVRKEKSEKTDSTGQKIEKPDAKPEESMDRKASMRQRFAGRMGSAKSEDKQQSTNQDQQWLGWIDKQNEGKGFVEWKKFQHKQLGEVEIGGFQPYLRINPPADHIKPLSESHAKFALYLAEQFAEIEMDEPEIEKLSSNLFRLKIKVHNKGDFPYATAMGQKSRNVTPIVLQLKFEDEDNMKFFGSSRRYDLQTLEAAGEKEYKWVIISPPGKGIDISIWAAKGGGKFQKHVILK
jgi:murein tripeptide amidase MpaA